MTKAANLSALGSNVTTSGNLSSASTLTLQTNSTTALTIDSSQNVGIGVTPSTWESGASVLQFNTSGAGGVANDKAAVWCRSDSMRLISGGYFNGSNYVYNATGVYPAVLNIDSSNGSMSFANGSTGTAGNTFSLNTRMTIDSSGNVGIGTSSFTYSSANRGLLEISGTSASLFSLKTNNTPTFYAISSANDIELTAVGASTPMRFTVNSAERMRIDSSGRVTTPYQPYAWVYPPTSFSITGGVDTTISGTWTVNTNTGSYFNTSGGVFTCPVAGVYFVSWNVFFSGSATPRLDTFVMKNGTVIMRTEQGKWATNSANTTTNSVGAIQCSANDTLTFGVYSNNTTTTYSSSAPWSFAQIYLLG